ncbi:magnesium/cobalt transporter CorA [Tenacibaculum ovolyticum]|uniref:magnesium/cobalt transporter CorA n=1 Tax=Tenacibaculum ovolyticum TaxID=104270 RepID=UPI001EEE5838|nr:magnesium/cobalt transporter CorA [Tenacibaculum ovolyticum]
MSKRIKKIGTAPGTVIFTGNKKVDKVHIHYMQYDAKSLSEKVFNNHTEIYLDKSLNNNVDWYDVRGMHDTKLIEFFGESFNIHPLILEAVVDIHQRPRFDEYEKGDFILLRSLGFNKAKMEVTKEHVAIYFNQGFIATFQETESDLFELVRKRINSGKGRIRERGSDYLAYAIIDSIVDNYYITMESIEDVIEELDEQITLNQNFTGKTKIHQLKKELLILRKSIAPLREAIARFSKSDSNFVNENNRVFIRDLYGNTIQVMDTVESYRDMLNGLQDLFITEVSFKMNKVMQLLTLISVIFIPLTFLAGIYGMNFEYIPELKHENGYFILLSIMALIVAIMIFYFKRKKWF